MREYVQGQRMRAKTSVETEFPLRRLEYTFAHEDAPGETMTISHEVTPPSEGSIEVLLNQEIPRGQALGVYRLGSVIAYPADAGEPVEVVTEEIRNDTAFRVVLRSDKPPHASGWEYEPVTP